MLWYIELYMGYGITKRCIAVVVNAVVHRTIHGIRNNKSGVLRW